MKEDNLKKEDKTKYGEFVCSPCAAGTAIKQNKQKEQAKKMQNVTDNKKSKK